jgi:hypothetical protein
MSFRKSLIALNMTLKAVVQIEGYRHWDEQILSELMSADHNNVLKGQTNDYI